MSTVHDAKEVLSQTGENGIDIILTDMHLPDGDGINFLEWVRENNLPYGVVMITGHGDEEIAVAALEIWRR